VSKETLFYEIVKKVFGNFVAMLSSPNPHHVDIWV
jgi:hypothetical protein